MSQLFSPYSLKDVTYKNRIVVSPMCQYSSEDGVANDWHLVHLGARAVGGAGLVIAEATAVSPEGRISPGDAGLWNDSQIEPLARINHFVAAHGAVPGIQIAHAGRKASAALPWNGGHHLEANEGGWETIAPTSEPFGAELPKAPRAMTTGDIQRVKSNFVDTAKRALAAGYRTLQLHFAHGYLAHEFWSPLVNNRTDQYGGSWENRARFLLETLEAVREVWPENLPLMARLSVTDWTEGGVTVEESIELAIAFKKRGLDLLDVSHGFAIPDISRIPWGPGFLVPIAEKIRQAAGIPVSVGWLVSEPQQAEAIVANGQADLVMLARGSLADPHWPYHAAKALGVEHPANLLPVQYSGALKRWR
ncbi:MAG: NADH:flavin oxidoreductase [Planctomyces sp.]|nr:NADH:flavin oxidoreductase [Planctomyces sp.]